MINNVRPWILAVGALGLAANGCTGAGPATSSDPPLQGIVELDETPIGFELGGRLTEIAVKEGDRVEQGTLLARVDDTLERSARDAQAGQVEVAKQQASAVRAGARPEELRSLQARIDAAQATVQLLEKQVARERTLFERGAVAPAALDDLQGQLERASAERDSLEHSLKLMRQGARREDVSVAEARAQAASAALELNDARLVRHELRSPISGTVLDVNFEPGEVVGAAAPVFTLADTKKPYVVVFVPESAISRVTLGQAARVGVDALKGELGGRVEHIERRTEFTPRYLFSEKERTALVVRVKVRIDDAREQLRAGVPAFVRFSGHP